MKIANTFHSDPFDVDSYRFAAKLKTYFEKKTTVIFFFSDNRCGLLFD